MSVGYADDDRPSEPVYFPASFTSTNSGHFSVNWTHAPESQVRDPGPSHTVNPYDGSVIRKPHWVTDRFVCACTRKGGHLCEHMMHYLWAGEDVGKHTVFGPPTVGLKFHRWLPITDEVLVEFQFEMIQRGTPELPVYMAVVRESSGPTSRVITKEDSLLTVINQMRDWYQQHELFLKVRSAYVAVVRLPCEWPNHNKQNDIDLVRRIKRALAAEQSGDPDIRMDVLHELALADTYYLAHDQKCFSCYCATQVFPDDIPKV